MAKLVKGFRTGHDGSIACPHRDCSTCDACEKAHPEIVEVYGAHFWVEDEKEREVLRKAIRLDEMRQEVLVPLLDGCPPDCTNRDSGNCPRCYEATGQGCNHGPVCDACEHEAKPEFYECGICSQMHSAAWDGDCREDAARFNVEDLDKKYGRKGWVEVPMPGGEEEDVSLTNRERWAEIARLAGDNDLGRYYAEQAARP